MRSHLYYGALGLGILLATGCESGSTKSETTAPEVVDAPVNASSSAGASTFHFKSRGPQAQLFFFEEGPSGVVFGDLQVERSETKTSRETLLFYSIQRCDPTTGECELLEQGSGLIPNGDFVAGRRVVTLHTNTSTEANPAFDRAGGSGGPITLQWTRTSAFVNDFHGHSRVQFEGVVIEKSQFAGTFSSALAQGSISGVAVSPASSSGTIGIVRNGLLVIQKGP
jgi:hypothetical protein